MIVEFLFVCFNIFDPLFRNDEIPFEIGEIRDVIHIESTEMNRFSQNITATQSSLKCISTFSVGNHEYYGVNVVENRHCFTKLFLLYPKSLMTLHIK